MAEPMSALERAQRLTGLCAPYSANTWDIVEELEAHAAAAVERERELLRERHRKELVEENENKLILLRERDEARAELMNERARDTYECGHARQSDHDPMRCATCSMQAAESALAAERAARAEAEKLLREVEFDRKTLPMTAGVTRMMSVGPTWFARRDAALAPRTEGAGT